MHKIFIFSLITLLTIACQPTSEEAISTEGAWVREAPPNASMMAGYVTILNNSDQNRIITSAKSKQFSMVEIHKTIIEDGVSKMRRQNDLPIPAGGSIELKPGSYHLMLMGPKSALQANDEVTVTLGLKQGDQIEEVDITMPVQKPK